MLRFHETVAGWMGSAGGARLSPRTSLPPCFGHERAHGRRFQESGVPGTVRERACVCVRGAWSWTKAWSLVF